MMNVRAMLTRRVTIIHNHGSLLVKIAPRHDRKSLMLPALFATAWFIFISSIFIKPLLRGPWPDAGFYILVFAGLCMVACAAILLGLCWIFGREEIAVDNGVMRWMHQVWWWTSKTEFPNNEISKVEAVTPWHGFENRVEFVTNGHRYKIGSRLLRDEAVELAQALSDAIGTQRRTHPPAT
ncbi:MAG TPA: hypothetical protein VF532_11525 [Candidatus Angelobacter sp.]